MHNEPPKQGATRSVAKGGSPPPGNLENTTAIGSHGMYPWIATTLSVDITALRLP